MRFTIGSRALTRANAFNPATTVVITGYNPNVFDAHGTSSPLNVRRFDGQPFGITAALHDGTLAVNEHREVWTHQDHVTVLPDLCEAPPYVPQPPVDTWAAGMAARDSAERITATSACYFVGARS